MIFKVGEKEYKLEFTYNSFKHLQDFNIKDLEKIEDNPFLMLPIVKSLLDGALNHDPKKEFTDKEVEDILETAMEENNIGDVLTDLVGLLEDSSFFKSLQKKTKKKAKK
jgi:hypothetical protein